MERNPSPLRRPSRQQNIRDEQSRFEKENKRPSLMSVEEYDRLVESAQRRRVDKRVEIFQDITTFKNIVQPRVETFANVTSLVSLADRSRLKTKSKIPQRASTAAQLLKDNEEKIAVQALQFQEVATESHFDGLMEFVEKLIDDKKYVTQKLVDLRKEKADSERMLEQTRLELTKEIAVTKELSKLYNVEAAILKDMSVQIQSVQHANEFIVILNENREKIVTAYYRLKEELFLDEDERDVVRQEVLQLEMERRYLQKSLSELEGVAKIVASAEKVNQNKNRDSLDSTYQQFSQVSLFEKIEDTPLARNMAEIVKNIRDAQLKVTSLEERIEEITNQMENEQQLLNKTVARNNEERIDKAIDAYQNVNVKRLRFLQFVIVSESNRLGARIVDPSEYLKRLDDAIERAYKEAPEKFQKVDMEVQWMSEELQAEARIACIILLEQHVTSFAKELHDNPFFKSSEIDDHVQQYFSTPFKEVLSKDRRLRTTIEHKFSVKNTNEFISKLVEDQSREVIERNYVVINMDKKEQLRVRDRKYRQLVQLVLFMRRNFTFAFNVTNVLINSKEFILYSQKDKILQDWSTNINVVCQLADQLLSNDFENLNKGLFEIMDTLDRFLLVWNQFCQYAQFVLLTEAQNRTRVFQKFCSKPAVTKKLLELSALHSKSELVDFEKSLERVIQICREELIEERAGGENANFTVELDPQTQQREILERLKTIHDRERELANSLATGEFKDFVDSAIISDVNNISSFYRYTLAPGTNHWTPVVTVSYTKSYSRLLFNRLVLVNPFTPVLVQVADLSYRVLQNVYDIVKRMIMASNVESATSTPVAFENGIEKEAMPLWRIVETIKMDQVALMKYSQRLASFSSKKSTNAYDRTTHLTWSQMTFVPSSLLPNIMAITRCWPSMKFVAEELYSLLTLAPQQSSGKEEEERMQNVTIRKSRKQKPKKSKPVTTTSSAQSLIPPLPTLGELDMSNVTITRGRRGTSNRDSIDRMLDLQ